MTWGLLSWVSPELLSGEGTKQTGCLHGLKAPEQ